MCNGNRRVLPSERFSCRQQQLLLLLLPLLLPLPAFFLPLQRLLLWRWRSLAAFTSIYLAALLSIITTPTVRPAPSVLLNYKLTTSDRARAYCVSDAVSAGTIGPRAAPGVGRMVREGAATTRRRRAQGRSAPGFGAGSSVRAKGLTESGR